MSMHTYTTLPLYFPRLTEGEERGLKVRKNTVKEGTYNVEKRTWLDPFTSMLIDSLSSSPFLLFFFLTFLFLFSLTVSLLIFRGEV